MPHNHMFRFILSLTAVSVLLFGCATPASLQPSAEVRKEQRELAIIRHIESELSADAKHVNFGFGDEYIIKPPSFKPLDSLYALLYDGANYNTASRNEINRLSKQIDSVKSKVLVDTVLFKYEIAHLFGIQKGDSIHYISATFLLDATNKVERVSIDYMFNEHRRLSNQFIQYNRRESFIDPGYQASREELQFYSFFDAELRAITTAIGKGNFIGHTLKVMRAANIQRTIETEKVLKQFVLNDITGNIQGYDPVKWSPVYTLIDEDNQLIGYWVDHEWKYTDVTGTTHHMIRTFELDTYFRITGVFAIDQVAE
jgi:hypothetical protein